jgi:hypothetical protein
MRVVVVQQLLGSTLARVELQTCHSHLDWARTKKRERESKRDNGGIEGGIHRRMRL